MIEQDVALPSSLHLFNFNTVLWNLDGVQMHLIHPPSQLAWFFSYTAFYSSTLQALYYKQFQVDIEPKTQQVAADVVFQDEHVFFLTHSFSALPTFPATGGRLTAGKIPLYLTSPFYPLKDFNVWSSGKLTTSNLWWVRNVSLCDLDLREIQCLNPPLCLWLQHWASTFSPGRST